MTRILDSQDAFLRTIEQAGLTPPERIIADGRLHRFSSNGDPDDDAGWYILHTDGIPAGAFGCWRSDVNETWSAGPGPEATAADQANHARQLLDLRRTREEEEWRRHAEAALRAQALWNQAAPAPVSHPYLQRKRIQSHGLRVDGENRLIVPVMIGGTLSSLQFIAPDGGKRFLPGGQVHGGSHVLGSIEGAMVIGEGAATCASIHEASDLPTVMAFSAGNLLSVARALRAQYPRAAVIVAGDNDVSGIGQAKAQEAAEAIGGRVVLPDEAGTDFNDVAQASGLDVVRLRIHAAMPSGRHIFDEVYAYLGKFVSYPSEAAHVAHALWIVHTHLMDASESTPRLAFLSPEPGSGKTRALEITETLVPRPVEAINATPAYLFRKISDPAGRPTILFDEIDTVFGPRAREHEEIRGVINAGHRRGAMAGRCVIKGKEILTEELPAFSAVAMAGLGNLPDTILTRSIIIRMRRRAPGEHVEPYRRRIHSPEGYRLRDRLASWAAEHEAALNLCPAMPEGITDRNADVWESLLSIADEVGGIWPDRARVSAVTLVTDAMGAPPSLGVRLLKDLRTVFGDRECASTNDLLAGLIDVEDSPWGDLKGKPLDGRRLAKLLRPYDITPKPIRIETSVFKGYTRADLHDAWTRYLQPESSSPPIGLPDIASVTSVTKITGEEVIYVD
ncbi:MAG: DUF3631 domain-containing protein [Nitrospira sp.]|nr:DUF3631 domain-containing protein [Nitrospira sp.]